MKSDAVQSIVQMEPRILKQLVTEVRETVAGEIDDLSQTNKNSFGIVGMWNVRKTRRNSGRNRRKPTIITGLSY